jgi:hypothetical protein
MAADMLDGFKEEMGGMKEREERTAAADGGARRLVSRCKMKRMRGNATVWMKALFRTASARKSNTGSGQREV